MKKYAVFIISIMLCAAMLCGCAAKAPAAVDPGKPAELPIGQAPEAPESSSGSSIEKTDATSGATVSVSSVDELVEAIGSDRRVVLSPGEYDISEWMDGVVKGGVEDWNESHENLVLQEVYDGYELQVHDISDIAIFGTGSYEDVLITVDPRYAAILAFYDCSGVTLEHFTAGHTLGSECGGSVLYFERCSSVLIEDTDLYGCGIYGVEAYFCNNLAVQDSILRDCSYGPAAIGYGSGLLSFDGCEFYGNTGSFAIFDNDKPVYFSSCTFGGIESGIQFNDGVVLDPSNELEEYTGEYPDIEEDWDGEYPDTESDFEEEGDQG